MLLSFVCVHFPYPSHGASRCDHFTTVNARDMTGGDVISASNQGQAGALGVKSTDIIHRPQEPPSGFRPEVPLSPIDWRLNRLQKLCIVIIGTAFAVVATLT